MKNDCNTIYKLFEEIYSLNLKRINYFIYSYTNDMDMAKILTSEVFEKLWLIRNQIDFNEDIFPLLLVMARNRTLNYLRREKIIRTYSENEKKRMTEIEINIETLAGSNLNSLNSQEIIKLINESIAQMTKETRETFLLSRFSNLKNIEIASKEGISVKTVEYRIKIALRILRKKLKDYMPFILGFISRLLFIN